MLQLTALSNGQLIANLNMVIVTYVLVLRSDRPRRKTEQRPRVVLRR